MGGSLLPPPQAPWLHRPLNMGSNPWPEHCPTAAPGFSVKIPQFWGATVTSPPSLPGK